MKTIQLSPPIISTPIHTLGQAVTVHSFMSGADIKIYRIKGGSANFEVIGRQKAPQSELCNIPVKQLTNGDQLFATQSINIDQQFFQSVIPSPHRASTIFPKTPLIAPYINTPLYTCAKSIVVGNIVNGATVRVFRNHRKIF